MSVDDCRKYGLQEMLIGKVNLDISFFLSPFTFLMNFVLRLDENTFLAHLQSVVFLFSLIFSPLLFFFLFLFIFLSFLCFSSTLQRWDYKHGRGMF